MVAYELEGIEIDRCLCCDGVWLDAGELEMVTELAGADPGGDRDHFQGHQAFHLFDPLGWHGHVHEGAVGVADLTGALASSFFGAVGSAGPRCTSTGRLIIHEKVYDTFI